MPTWTMLAKGLLGLDGEIVGLNGSGHSYGKRNKYRDRGPSTYQEKCPQGVGSVAGGKTKAPTWLAARLKSNCEKDSEWRLLKTFFFLPWQSTQGLWHGGLNRKNPVTPLEGETNLPMQFLEGHSPTPLKVAVLWGICSFRL